MKAFSLYVKECVYEDEGQPQKVMPFVYGAETTEGLDFTSPENREAVNDMLSEITDSPERLDPVVIYERVRTVLDDVGYSLPSAMSLDKLFDEDEEDGDEVFALGDSAYLYFAYVRDDRDNFEALAEVVNEEGLEEILHGEGDDQ